MHTPEAPVTTSMLPDFAGQITAIAKQKVRMTVITTRCRSRLFVAKLSGIQPLIVCLVGYSSIGVEKAK